MYNPSEDLLVQQLKRILPLRSNRGMYLDPEHRLGCEVIATIELAIKLYEDNGVCGNRDIMEAGLLAPDIELDFFKKYASPYLTTTVVDMYRKLFYDIDEKRDMVFWVQRNLFVPMKSLRGDRFHSAYMWKVVAYHGGLTKLIQFAIDGMNLEDELRMWLRSMGLSEYVRQVLKSTHSYAKLLDGAGTPALPLTASWERQQDADNGITEDTTGVADAITEALVTAQEDVSGPYEYPSKNMYTDEDNAK